MNDQSKRVVTLLFFPGFYNSILSEAIGRSEEHDAEYMAEQEASQEYYPETYQPEHLRITASEYAELFLDCTNYSACYLKVAQFWVEAFDAWAKENLGTPEKSFVFEKMISPREYNFTTDRVFAHVPLDVLESLFQKSAAEDHKTLAEVIKDTFTSYGGFISFYSNDLEAWLAKPLAEWDYNELGTLVGAVVQFSEGWEDRAAFSEHMYESIFSGNGEEEEARNVDWPKFEQKVAELREQKKLDSNACVAEGTP